MKEKPDYKKSYFEKLLNDGNHSIVSLRRRLHDLGYFYEYENGRYYVYDSYEWRIKQEFNKTCKPLFNTLFRTIL